MSEKNKKENLCPSCYGSFVSAAGKCIKCEFCESCRYYTSTEKKMKSRTHVVSFEAASNLICDNADFDHIPGCGSAYDDKKESIADALGRFFRYLLDLDDYTLGMISQIISPAECGSSTCTVSSLSRIHGCSRQAMHRKILNTIGKYPELAGLFQNILCKLTSGRRRFLRNQSSARTA